MSRLATWTERAFVEEAHAWIRTHVNVIGPITQPHVQWWSTVMRVPTLAGVLWFKAAAGPRPFEPMLLTILAGIAPERVPEVVARDDERGWMLLRHAGTQLRELVASRDDLWRWERFLPEHAELQLATSSAVDAMRAAGVPHEPLDGLAERIGALLDDEPFLMLDEDDGLPRADRDRLRAALPKIAALAGELAAFGIPEAIQHDDLNDGNVFVDGERYRTLDWGDACVSHPLHTLTVTLRATAFRLDLAPGGTEIERLRDAYLEPFSRFGSRDEVVRAAELAYRTGTLARALAWRRSLEPLPPEERADDLDGVPYGLRRFVEHAPIGSWRD